MKFKTELNGRVLWYDGTNEVEPDSIHELILQGIDLGLITAREKSEDVNLFNDLSDLQIQVDKKEINDLDFSWKMPSSYLKLNLEDLALSKLDRLDLPPSLAEKYVQRIHQEIKEIQERKIENLFRALVFLVDTLSKNQILWGVGRGSSCACLVLFLIGLHEVDPIKYRIPLDEFFH